MSTTTSYSTFTRTVTKLVEAEEEQEAPEFTCPPMTVTNLLNATLELGDDCGLTYNPPPEDDQPSGQAKADLATTSSFTTTIPTTASASLKPRAAASICLITTTIVSRITISRVTVVTRTVTETTTAVGFSCVPMSVTNAVGDELSLDEECKLESSPNEDASAVTSSSSNVRVTAAAAAGGGGGGSATMSTGEGGKIGLWYASLVLPIVVAMGLMI